MKNHFAPKFANKEWAIDGKVMHYYRSQHTNELVAKPKGWTTWGQRRKLWSNEIERNLAQDLEDETSIIYRKMIRYRELNERERMKWAQFILSQIVRTPNFMRYEKFASETLFPEIKTHLGHERVGCEQCGDLFWISQRKWLLIVLKENSELIRTDNPVFLTGFIDRPSSAIFYPLTPRLLWVAQSMPVDWKPNWQNGHKGKYIGAEKGSTFSFLLNFHFIRSAREFITRTDQNEETFSHIAEGALGSYPMPPFSLHILNGAEENKAFESIRMIMCICDDKPYARWHSSELELLENI